MRTRAINSFIIVFAFILGGTFSFVLMENYGNKVNKTPIASTGNEATCSMGVVRCDADITIDETGISASIGKIYDAVVMINNYNASGALASTGSGFVYKTDDNYGYIMTNEHVAEGAKSLSVIMSNDVEVDATYLGGDKYLDLAVLRIPKEQVISTAVLGTSEKSELGDTIFTVGSPVGYEYRGTVTKGILSGKNRMVSVTVNTQSDWLMKVIQIDAAINPGNSGGPICNIDGEVIGINSMKLVEDEIEGMGFAIPIEDALKYVDELEAGRAIERPLIGITMVDVNEKYTLYQYGISVDKSITDGVVILSVVKDSGASKSGLKKGDVIIGINGVKVTSAAYLKYELYKYGVGDTVEINFIRDGSEKTANITLTKSDE